MTNPIVRKRRCAIYTRKSSEEGLEMEFNSLDAQREACEAYIASQRGEGWLLIDDRYDDGGVSGGTIERPALKRLLADVAAGRIDVVAVYKIDRLSRSMLDFLKLPWDPQCLLYYENPRRVGTASEDQVRRKVYTSSIGRWKQYEKQLTELISAIGATGR